MKIDVYLNIVPANLVPAAAVIRGGRALFGIIGRKVLQGGQLNLKYKLFIIKKISFLIFLLEFGISWQNFWSRGRIRKIQKEYQGRRRLSSSRLTLQGESMGIKKDQIPLQSMQSKLSANFFDFRESKANALSTPPGEYGRKVKTQRN